MDGSSFPTRSQDGLSALDVFYDEFNDVNFFVEDEDQENLYEIIFRRMFPDFRIARIFPLGGKLAILNHSSQSQARANSPRSVYLVDKDFDDFLGLKIDRPMLFYLDRYCIENYFIESGAIIEFIVESSPKMKRSEISESLNLDARIPELMESIRPLFQLFYCVQRFGLGIKNCSLPVERFCCEGQRWIIDDDKLNIYSQKIASAASGTAHAAALIDPLTYSGVLFLTTLDIHTVVSGKHTCALVFHYLKYKYSIGAITFESFLFRLAKNASLESLRELAITIRTALATPV